MTANFFVSKKKICLYLNKQVDFDFEVNCALWFGDGTFRVTPDDFDQLYTLHGFINGEVFPCIYALLPGRSEEIYRRFLDHVIRLVPAVNPASVVLDFEIATMKAFQAQFLRKMISGCMFHSGQCLWRELQLVDISTYLH